MMQFDASDRILIIGLGRTGTAAAEVLRKRGAAVYATDEKPPAELKEARALVERIGAHFVEPQDLGGILPTLACAVLSPGVPLSGGVARSVQASGVPVLSEVEVAYRLCKAPIVAVTGTKGKSTTTALIGHLLRASGRRVRVGGNIGNPLIREAFDANPDDWIVAELSSFQLETIDAFKPRIAAILNISADHLDRYRSIDDYAEAKFRIVANQEPGDTFVGNLDDPRVARLREDSRLRAQQLWFSLRGATGAAMARRGDDIVYTPPGDPQSRTVARRSDIALPGEHNVANAMAAILVAIAAGIEPVALREALRTFAPMPHRLQAVAEIDGVVYIDDSKATNPAAVMAALEAYDRPILLIAGGRSKGSDFAAMGRAIERRVKALILIGESAAEIAGAASVPQTVRADGLAEAVERARSLTSAGDIVLLSPGCASFDMFNSAEERGERFAAAVHSLEEKARA